MLENCRLSKIKVVNAGAKWSITIDCSKELNSTDTNQVYCFIVNNEKCILDKLKNNEW